MHDALHQPLSDQFWPQFGLEACPRFDGLRVLEIGCGFGSRCFEAATHGAKQVVGIDTIRMHVEAANRRRDQEFPGLSRSVEFRHCPVEQLDDSGFDVVISESAFEHIMNVDVVLEQIRAKLAPGGNAYIAFGPLYHSPYGDHGWLRAALPFGARLSWPWGHLLVPERVLFRRLQRLKGLPLYHQTRDWAYMDLNQLTIHDYERLFAHSGMEVRRFETNIAHSRLGRTVRLVSRVVPRLRKYLTFNVGAVLSAAAPSARRSPAPPA